jgi:hypothetical protein
MPEYKLIQKKKKKKKRTSENGLLPLIHLSITTLRLVPIMRVPQRGVQVGTPSRVGKHQAPCYGSTENVHCAMTF